jgi:MFS family permease
MYGFTGFAGNFYVTLLSSFLEDKRHLDRDTTSWLQSLPFAFGLVACVSGGLFSDWFIRRTGNRKWGRRLQGAVGLAVGAVGWLALNWVGPTWALAAVLCLIFFCNDLSMAPAWAACADIGERHAGTLGGAMNMIGNVLGALGNLVAGWLWSWDLTALVFVIYGCSYALASACWLCVDVTPLARSSFPPPGGAPGVTVPPAQ